MGILIDSSQILKEHGFTFEDSSRYGDIENCWRKAIQLNKNSWLYVAVNVIVSRVVVDIDFFDCCVRHKDYKLTAKFGDDNVLAFKELDEFVTKIAKDYLE